MDYERSEAEAQFARLSRHVQNGGILLHPRRRWRDNGLKWRPCSGVCRMTDALRCVMPGVRKPSSLPFALPLRLSFGDECMNPEPCLPNTEGRRFFKQIALLP